MTGRRKGRTGIAGAELRDRVVVLACAIARYPPWSRLAQAVEAPGQFGRDRGSLCQQRRGIELENQQRGLMNPG